MKRIKSIPALPPRCAPYGDGARASARFTVPKQATRKTFRPRKCLIFRGFSAVFNGFSLFPATPAAPCRPGVLTRHFGFSPRRQRNGCRVLAFGDFSEPFGAVGLARTAQEQRCQNLSKCLIFRELSAVSGSFGLFSVIPDERVGRVSSPGVLGSPQARERCRAAKYPR
jgi:hypothetical protein